MPITIRRRTSLRRDVAAAGAATLDVAIYEDVEADRCATTQALAIVVASSLAAGLGARGIGGSNPANVAFFTVVALMAWAAWAVVTYQVGVRILPGPQTHADVGELLRTIGFATTSGAVPHLRPVAGHDHPRLRRHRGVDALGHDRGRAAGTGLHEPTTRGGRVRSGVDVGDRVCARAWLLLRAARVMSTGPVWHDPGRLMNPVVRPWQPGIGPLCLIFLDQDAKLAGAVDR